MRIIQHPHFLHVSTSVSHHHVQGPDLGTVTAMTI